MGPLFNDAELVANQRLARPHFWLLGGLFGYCGLRRAFNRCLWESRRNRQSLCFLSILPALPCLMVVRVVLAIHIHDRLGCVEPAGQC